MKQITENEFFANIETIIFEQMKQFSLEINKDVENLEQKIHYFENELEKISSLFFWKKNSVLNQINNLKGEHEAKESYFFKISKEITELNKMLQNRTDMLNKIPDYNTRVKQKYEYIVKELGVSGYHHPKIQEMIERIYEQSLLVKTDAVPKQESRRSVKDTPKKTEDILRMYVGRKYHEKYGVDKVFELACFLGSEKIRNKLNLGNIYSKPETVEKFIEEITAKIPHDVFSEIQKFWTEEKQKNMGIYNLLKTQENLKDYTSNFKM